jgi:hypothetical protein
MSAVLAALIPFLDTVQFKCTHSRIVCRNLSTDTGAQTALARTFLATFLRMYFAFITDRSSSSSSLLSYQKPAIRTRIRSTSSCPWWFSSGREKHVFVCISKFQTAIELRPSHDRVITGETRGKDNYGLRLYGTRHLVTLCHWEESASVTTVYDTKRGTCRHHLHHHPRPPRLT